MPVSGIRTNSYHMFYPTNKVLSRQQDNNCIQNENFNILQSQEVFDSLRESEKSYDMQSLMKKLKSVEIEANIKNGETEKSYPLGEKTFTTKEWEQLLIKLDDSIDAIKKNTKAENKDKITENVSEQTTLSGTVTAFDSDTYNYFKLDNITVYTKDGTSLAEKALTDERYTDKETGISWYVGDDGKPYMVGDDAKKFNELCQKNGEFPLKKFAEMVGTIQQLDDNTTAFVGDNGIAVKGKDGREYIVDITGMSYLDIMSMLSKAADGGDYYNDRYWNDIKYQR